MVQDKAGGAKKRLTATRSNGDETRARIINAAEALFGARGFASVSLRDITTKADVTLALASYHFGTKDNLFEAVVERRAHVLGLERRRRLGELSQPDARAILDAFMAPLFEFALSGEPGWPDYFRLLARLGEDNQWIDLLSKHFDETAQQFIDALCKALPNATRHDVIRTFTMVLHAMLSTVSQHSRVDKLAEGKLRGADLKGAYPVLLQFATTGMESFNRGK
ncbi:TetR/AcrR family transcriptional regulator [Rhizobium sp. L1K21]|uniref:TetR/AcrR family transcriptional regulator n=1 Tax=Rhizobium sp. L1K21 TaxID=2954933 RepID=UPI002091F3DD|nr:TetR/AcrR family transcriptional regulator [Rhizobium sp. L1K21]MCO6187585.1 TetR family transcriptional regulator [Rhizobium sp. L1K21]